MDDTEQTIEALLDAARGDDRNATSALLQAVTPQVRAMVHQRLERSYRRHNDWVVSLFSTGDVVQDILIGVLSDLRQFRGTDARSLTAWLATQVEHQILGRLRFFRRGKRDQRRVKSLEAADTRDSRPDPADRGPTPGTAAESAEMWAAVQEAMVGMSADERAVLEHALEPGLSWEEVARRLGLPTAEAARQRHKRARARLSLRLATRFPGLFGVGDSR